MFKELKRVSNYGRFQKSPEVLEIDGSRTADRREQVEGFGNVFEAMHVNATARIDAAKVREAKEKMQAKYGTSDPIRLFDVNNAVFDRCNEDADARVTLGEINTIFASLKNKYSSGWDRIPNKLLKCTGPGFRRKLAILMNNLYNLGHTPRCLKYGLVSPILKAGKCASQIVNYRPISLLSNLAKIW